MGDGWETSDHKWKTSRKQGDKWETRLQCGGKVSGTKLEPGIPGSWWRKVGIPVASRDETEHFFGVLCVLVCRVPVYLSAFNFGPREYRRDQA